MFRYVSEFKKKAEDIFLPIYKSRLWMESNDMLTTSAPSFIFDYFTSSTSYSNMSTEQHVSQDKEWNFSLKDFSQRGSIWSWKRMLTCGKHSITQTCQGSVKHWRGNGGKDWSKEKSKTQKWERKRKEEGTDGVWKGVKGAEQMSHDRRHWKNGAWKNE